MQNVFFVKMLDVLYCCHVCPCSLFFSEFIGGLHSVTLYDGKMPALSSGLHVQAKAEFNI